MTIRGHVAAQLRCIEEDRVRLHSVNAVLEINPEALAIADALDRLPGERRGVLHGMTILIKDNINTGDRMHTSAGSLALADHYAAEDAHLVKRLRAAGAVILGKANMTELANFMSDNMPDGYSARGWYVRNPHNAAESPSGSSSGSAAAVAAGFCDAAVGTETAGSVISPSQVCGVVGVKPTIGLVSRSGIVPISTTLDTAGPIAGSVPDAAKLLSVMAGYDPQDPATAVMKDRAVPDYVDLLEPDGLKKARIGIGRGIRPGDKYRPYAQMLLRFLAEQGAVLVDIDPIGEQEQLFDIMRYEFKAAIKSYFEKSGRKAVPRTLSDIAAFNLINAETALKYGQSQLDFALNETSGLLNEPVYLNAIDARKRLQIKMSALYKSHRLDAIVEPAGWNTVGPFCGYPTGTVPIGRYDNNIPVGCYLMCRPFEEVKLLSLLYGIERNWPRATARVQCL